MDLMFQYECLRCGNKTLILMEGWHSGVCRWKCTSCGLKTCNPTHYPNMRYDMFIVEVAVWLWKMRGLTTREVSMVLMEELGVNVPFGTIAKWANGKQVTMTRFRVDRKEVPRFMF